MSRKSSNLIKLPRFRSSPSQWYTNTDEYGSFLVQDNLIKQGLRAFFYSRKNVIYSDCIIQRSFLYTYVYIPIFFLSSKHSINYFYKKPYAKFYPYLDLELQDRFVERRFTRKLRKYNLLRFIKRNHIERKEIYYLLSNILNFKPLKVKLICILHIDFYAPLFAKFIAYHLTRKKDFRRFKDRIVRLLDIGRQYKTTVGGVFILCTGRLNKRKVLRKQRQWLTYNRAPINTYNSITMYSSNISKTNFGIYGIKVWVYINKPKPLTETLLKNINKRTNLKRLKRLNKYKKFKKRFYR